jgi:hypothetical protein
MFGHPFLRFLDSILSRLEVHLLADNVDALEKGQPFGDHVGHVDQERAILRVSRQQKDLNILTKQGFLTILTVFHRRFIEN